MKPDRYTKIVLTVIAACLVALTLHTYLFVQTANANPLKQHYAMVPLNADGSINVHIAKSDELDVNVASVAGGVTMDVNVAQVANQNADYPLQVTGSN